MYIIRLAFSLLAAILFSCTWISSVHATDDAPLPPFPPPIPPPPPPQQRRVPRTYAPVYGPVEQKNAGRVSSRYAAGSYRRAEDPVWLKEHNLKPPRQLGFARTADLKGDGYVRMPLKTRQNAAANTSSSSSSSSSPHGNVTKRAWPPRPDLFNYTMVRPDTVFTNSTIPPGWSAAQPFGFSVSSSDAAPDGGADGASKPRKWAWERLKEYAQGTAFLARADFGTPPQINYLFLDTATVWSWANPLCSGTEDDRSCLANGHYSPVASNTSKSSARQFAYKYGSGGALGNMYTDVVRIDTSYPIPQFAFGVATYSQYFTAGVLGVAYSDKIESVVTGLWEYGLIQAPQFSIGLGNQGENLGEIVFGGVNHFKFAGQLQPVPVSPSFGQQQARSSSPKELPDWYQWGLNLTSVGVQMPGDAQPTIVYKGNEPYLLDTGSTLSYVPDGLVTGVGSALWAVRTDDNVILVNCALRDMSGTVNFFFNGGKLRIDVRFKDFILHSNATSCYLGTQPASVYNSSNTLGTTFMRGAYMVFDPWMECIWMATYYSCGDGVVSIGQEAGDPSDVMGQCT